ncbi:competence type IV pilus assembly protein ComGB [Shouchella sp. JSM 1781072]|uniref:competence type IV pilus assembly protein ComGB n=1 Tax=Bacillaceae TaxID=186817 RepID=UPI0020D134C4|nr:competence type IV pilus assembly protein ComGB [Alkalihalobacillus sp. LMS6]UTR04983.1 type II secretion system F family protein [Alkalihalobacillus sp. LMS6]
MMFRSVWKKRNKQADISFIQKLGELLQSGYSADQALSFLSVQVNDDWKEMIRSIKQQLTMGQPLSKSLQALALPSDVQSYIFFYEEQGQVADGLMEAAKLYQKRLKTTLQLQKLLRYPLVLAFGVMMALLILNLYIVPHFQSLFSTLNQSPPRFILFFFSFLENLPYVCIAFLLLASIGYVSSKRYIHHLTPHEKVHILLKWKLSQTIMKQVITFYFSLQLGKLLQTGMSINEALNIFEKQSYLPFFKDEARKMNQSLKQGNSLASYMRHQPYYLSELPIVVENGSRTAKLALDLQFFSEWIIEELDRKLEKLLQIIQPILFVCIGCFIFFLFLMIMLPMYEMFDLM